MTMTLTKPLSELRLSDDIVLPLDAVTETFAFIAKRRVGKSNAAVVLAEQMYYAGIPWVCIDPKGDWWGIKSSADGKKAGFPIVVFGGEHADVPINEHSGAAVAELIATGNRSCLIDLGGWMVGERTRFFIAFASTLFKHTRGARHLVIDEVHNFAPQGKILDPDAGKMLHWANRMASEGRGKGITIIAASQRPQKVHKDFVTSCETLIAMRVIHLLDRNSIKDWIDGCADPAVGKEVLATLAQMKRGEAWIWSPEIEYGPERILFPMFKTYDSFKPQAADVGKLKGWADVDLEDVKSKLQTVVKDAQANDPVLLKRRIAELEREMRGQTFVTPAPSIDPAAVDRAYKDGYDTGVMHAAAKGFDQGYASASSAIAGIVTGVLRAGDEFMVQLRAAAKAISESPRPAAPPANSMQPPMRRSATVSYAPVKTPVITREKPAAHSNGKVSGVEQRILNALAELELMGTHTPEPELLAFMAGYSHTRSKGFANAMSSMRTQGLVEGRSLSPAGRSLAYPPAKPRTPAELQDRIIAMLGGASARVLRPLINAYPDPLERQALAEASGYGHSRSKGFANALSRFRTLGFIDYPNTGSVVAKPLLFLE